MNLEIITVSKVSQRKTNIIIIYVDSKTIQSELTYKTDIETDTVNKLTVTKGERSRERIN